MTELDEVLSSIEKPNKRNEMHDSYVDNIELDVPMRVDNQKNEHSEVEEELPGNDLQADRDKKKAKYDNKRLYELLEVGPVDPDRSGEADPRNGSGELRRPGKQPDGQAGLEQTSNYGRSQSQT